MSSEKEILALEDRRFDAMIKGDFGALDKLVHEEKKSWIESVKSGKTRYKSARPSEREVRFSGDVALVRGKAAIEAETGGQPRSLRLLFLNAWVRTPQGWKFAAWQSCPQPA